MIKLQILKRYLTIIIWLVALPLFGQSYKIGVRSGLNFSTFLGPKESVINEKFGFSGGFHFGLNFTYYINPKIGFRGEFLYIQNGSKTSFNGPSYFLIRLPNSLTPLIELGNRDQSLNISNAYVSFPITAQVQLNKKWEVFGGAYVSLLVGPTAGGKVDFISFENDEGIFFEQSLQYSYGSDNAQDFPPDVTIVQEFITILVDDERVNIPRRTGAYYDFSEEVTDNYINPVDAGLIFGVNYFLNRSFYVGMRAEYGLLDITQNSLDRSFEKVNDDGSFIFRDDADKHFGLQASFGFRF